MIYNGFWKQQEVHGDFMDFGPIVNPIIEIEFWIDKTTGCGFTKLLMQICKILHNFGPQNLEIIITKGKVDINKS